MTGKIPTIHVVGGGMAGCEAAWQALKSGAKVVLHEMRPTKMTDAHKTGNLAELVCSNSFKSLGEASAAGELKAEMRDMDSIIVGSALSAAVPAGQALAVEREVFSALVEKKLAEHPQFIRSNEEITELPSYEEMLARDEIWIIATGPLTSDGMADELKKLSGGDERLHFYDAIAPVLAGDSLDKTKMFWGNRYQSSEEGDYLNIPLNRDQYDTFIREVAHAEKMPLHDFENTQYFEACLPIEVMVERGHDTLRFGPMKPVGFLTASGRMPYAVIQLRMENAGGTMFSMVGFQTKMKWPEQRRVFSMLPGMENAEFYRFGSVHRNTYLNSPKVLNQNLSFKSNDRVFLAGQITGVEGYTESAAIGLVVGRAAAARAYDQDFVFPPDITVMGALVRYVNEGFRGEFSPMNANLGLLPPIPKTKAFRKADRQAMQCRNAREAMQAYLGMSH